MSYVTKYDLSHNSSNPEEQINIHAYLMQSCFKDTLAIGTEDNPVNNYQSDFKKSGMAT